MDWAEEIKMSFRKTTARKGRRAKSRDALKDATIPSTTSASSSSKITTDNPVHKDIMLDIQQSSNTDTPPTASVTSPSSSNLTMDSESSAPRRRIPGGWADNTSIRIIKSKDSIDDDERFQLTAGSKLVTSSTLEDDIPIIPDLDDVKDEILMNEIVEPPNISENRVVMLKELNLDLLTQNAFSAIEDIDLSILTRCLQAQDALNEPDEVWEWDKLFADVIAEIHSDTVTRSIGFSVASDEKSLDDKNT